VPGGSIKPISVANSTTQTTTISTTTISYSNFNYFNLTGVGYINPANNILENFTVVNHVDNVSIVLNTSSAYPWRVCKV